MTTQTLLFFLSAQAAPVTAFAIFLLSSFALIFLYVDRRRAIGRKRSGHTEDHFVSQLSSSGFDPRIARNTYRYLQNGQNVTFPILSQDALNEDLGLNPDALEQAKSALVDASHRELSPALRKEPLVTVEDLVRFVQASPRRGDIAA